MKVIVYYWLEVRTYVSMNLEMFSVAKLQLLTSGLGFCVFSLGSIIYLVF